MAVFQTTVDTSLGILSPSFLISFRLLSVCLTRHHAQCQCHLECRVLRQESSTYSLETQPVRVSVLFFKFVCTNKWILIDQKGCSYYFIFLFTWPNLSCYIDQNYLKLIKIDQNSTKLIKIDQNLLKLYQNSPKLIKIY